MAAKIFLQTSKDGGCNYTTGRDRDIAVENKPRHRVIWRRNGRYDTTAVFRFYINEPVQIAICQMTADMVGGE